MLKNALTLLVRLLSGSRLKKGSQLIAHGRELAFDLGLEVAPVGAGNGKTGTPGTYRPLGLTCPKCTIEHECYARYGPVGIHQERAPKEFLPSVVAALIAMTTALKLGTLARLHISGDFFCDGEIDAEYIHWLVFAGDLVQKQFATVQKIAWTYTKIDPLLFEQSRLTLQSVGIEIVYSGQKQTGGSVVWPHALIHLLHADDGNKTTFIPCLSQTHNIPCKGCCLCWQTREKNICIAFEPHGPRTKDLYLSFLNEERRQDYDITMNDVVSA